MSFSTNDSDQIIEQKIMELISRRKRIRNFPSEDEEELDLTVKETFYNSPVKRYILYREDKKKYESLYNQSKLKYYMVIGKENAIKYIKKKLLKKILAIMFITGIMFFINYYGIKDKIYNFFGLIWKKFKGLFVKTE